jgi:SAM-dependent methyltransferase
MVLRHVTPPAAGGEGGNAIVSESAAGKVDYGNWVSRRLVVVPGVLALLFTGLAFLLPGLGIVAVIFVLFFLYFAYARFAFSPRGGNIQTRVQDLLLDHLMAWDGVGKVLDIGCGNGPLTIAIAKRFAQAEVMGVDYWAAAWEYSKGVCERNTKIEGVAGRVAFERASASSLPFDDGAFDLVVSNLVFHEVRDVRDKKELIREALRVVKDGGWFVFQDLFLWKAVYGDVDDLVETIRGWGVQTVALADTSGSEFIPTALKLPFMLGTVAILHGRK